MSQTMPSLTIVAQPKPSYRERYMCEMRGNRAQRFIRAEDNPEKYVYPTIEIPIEWIEWINQNQQTLYIRLTLVTIPNEDVEVKCIHPYRLGTEDVNVIKDPASNSLYFPVSNDELIIRRKSFQFTLQKLTHYQLKNYGPIRLLNSGIKDKQRFEDPKDVKKLIDIYQLGQSQLIFSIAVFQNNTQFPVIYDVSSVYSQTMNAITTRANDDDISFRCSPLRGDWHGGDEILMVIPRIDKRRAFSVRFDHPAMGQNSTISMEFVDAKTISFYTPQCPIPLTHENPSISIPIVVIQGDFEVARVDFVYQSLNKCLYCNSNLMFARVNSTISNKRRYSTLDDTDDVDSYDEPNDKMEKKEVEQPHIEEFFTTVRTSTTVKTEDQLLILENAIQEGNCDLAIKLLKETNGYLERANDQGQTPLLIAAKFNQIRLIRAILKKQPELAKRVDRQKNNLLHLLAKIPEDKAIETTDNIFMILDNKTKEFLILGLNENKQTPEQIARIYGNTKFINLLKSQMIFNGENE